MYGLERLSKTQVDLNYLISVQILALFENSEELCNYTIDKIERINIEEYKFFWRVSKKLNNIFVPNTEYISIFNATIFNELVDKLTDELPNKEFEEQVLNLLKSYYKAKIEDKELIEIILK